MCWKRDEVLKSMLEWRRFTIENTDPIDQDRVTELVKELHKVFQHPFVGVQFHESFSEAVFNIPCRDLMFYRQNKIRMTIPPEIINKLERETLNIVLGSATHLFPREVISVQLGAYKCGKYFSLPNSIFELPRVDAVLWHAYKIKEPCIEPKTYIWLELLKECHWCMFTDFFYLPTHIGNRPTHITYDNEWRPHNDHGPSVVYRDGKEFYFIHGEEVPRWLIMKKHKIRPRHILRSRLRFRTIMWMIEQYGWERFLKDVHAKHIATDKFGRMWRVDNFNRQNPLVVVEVLNGTPEPDGSYKKYFLRVPDSCRTPLSGVAWSYGVSELEYLHLVRRT